MGQVCLRGPMWFEVALAATLALACAVEGRAQDATTLSADGSGSMAVVVQPSPIFLLPDANRQPLRVAREGSRLRVTTMDAQWVTVQFQDPQYGLRTGYIERKFVRMEPSADLQPMDLSVPGGSPSAAARPPAPAPAVRERSVERRDNDDERSGRQPAAAAREQGDARDGQPVGRGASRTERFYIGLGLEGNGFLSNDTGLNSTAESGNGAGLVLGYGFTPRASLYVAFSGASMESTDFVGTYGLAHVDLGTRIHFRSGAGRVVPFVQAGLSGRAIAATLYSGFGVYDVTASGAGVSFGGGLNAHFTPALAFSGHVMWTVGNFSTFEVNGTQVDLGSSSATSARVHLGLVWFPHGRPRRP